MAFVAALEMVDIPKSIWTKAANCQIEPKFINIVDGAKNAHVYIQEVAPSDDQPHGAPVLFLHGASFTSQTWCDLYSMALIGAMGHTAVAVDLPGHGKTDACSFSNDVFLHHFIKAAKLECPIIISPSMSGGFSVPYLMKNSEGKVDPETAESRLTGFISISPVGLTAHGVDEYNKLKIPIGLVYGKNDKYPMKREALEKLGGAQNVSDCPIDEAGHACYMNKPDEWNKLLYNFVKAIDSGAVGIQGLKTCI